ncbi:transglutaminase family protein [Roseomonas sp. NAR14]|uniref:Transglutaminase family protein n=1 Tax=Roseomonas acroporae TaxID=2937791 RepID=A0A9X2BWP7_9PROT|nr:transglutaminase family protein [Roseomonas acroporae]
MIYKVRHATRYVYGSPVDLAVHTVRVQPRALPFQRVVATELLVEPPPARRRDALDHFGNHVTWLFHDAAHPSFEVTAVSEVEVRFPDPPPPEATPAWEKVVEAANAGGPGGGPGREAWRAAEFRFGSPMCPAHAGAGEYARKSFTPGRPVLAGLLELNERIYTEFKFRAGVTTLSTPVSQVLERREGVCQDFTHLMCSALRCLGIPARYTSGYIRTRPPPGQKRRQGADQSHAWVGAWMGPEHGWVDLDPTNGIVVKEEHVVLGWGRDYGDISPVRGVILGGGTDSLKVGVDLVPADEWE